MGVYCVLSSFISYIINIHFTWSSFYPLRPNSFLLTSFPRWKYCEGILFQKERESLNIAQCVLAMNRGKIKQVRRFQPGGIDRSGWELQTPSPSHFWRWVEKIRHLVLMFRMPRLLLIDLRSRKQLAWSSQHKILSWHTLFKSLNFVVTVRFFFRSYAPAFSLHKRLVRLYPTALCTMQRKQK